MPQSTTDIPIQSDALAVPHGPTLHRRWAVADQPWARLALLHGYGDHAGRHDHVLQWMAAHGVTAHAVDFRGHGRSAGPRGFVRRWAEYLDDLSAFLAIEELATKDGLPLFVFAHSHGGLVAAAAAQRGLLDGRCAGVILSAPYLALKLPIPPHMRLAAAVLNVVAPSVVLRSGIGAAMLTRDEAMLAADAADDLRGRGATPRWFAVATRVQAEVRATADRFRLPLLLLVAGDDSIASPAASVDWFEHVGSADKTIRHYADHRHELPREVGREGIFEEVLGWMRGQTPESKLVGQLP
jgi:alpha-beta hydrolase superfamily lysophospholipase